MSKYSKAKMENTMKRTKKTDWKGLFSSFFGTTVEEKDENDFYIDNGLSKEQIKILEDAAKQADKKADEYKISMEKMQKEMSKKKKKTREMKITKTPEIKVQTQKEVEKDQQERE